MWTSTRLWQAIFRVQDGNAAQDSLGSLLRTWRSESQVSQAALAVRLAISAQFLCDVERGRRSLSGPPLAALMREVSKSLHKKG